MTYKKINFIITSLALGMAIVIPSVTPALAQTAGRSVSSSVGGGANGAALRTPEEMERANREVPSSTGQVPPAPGPTDGNYWQKKTEADAMRGKATAQDKAATLMVSRADREINRRTMALHELATRIQSMKHISASEQSNLSTAIQNQITTLASLKAKIDADTDLQTLRADVQSITKSYRIYALIMPQAAIVAAADRMMTIAESLTTLSGKLQTKISAAQSAGHDVISLQTALTDLNAKVSDANTQAQAAVTEVSSLVPDQGNQTQIKANTAALKDARSKIKAARADLIAARKDVMTIVKGLRIFSRPTASSTATSTF